MITQAPPASQNATLSVMQPEDVQPTNQFSIRAMFVAMAAIAGVMWLLRYPAVAISFIGLWLLCLVLAGPGFFVADKSRGTKAFILSVSMAWGTLVGLIAVGERASNGLLIAGIAGGALAGAAIAEIGR